MDNGLDMLGLVQSKRVGGNFNKHLQNKHLSATMFVWALRHWSNIHKMIQEGCIVLASPRRQMDLAVFCVPKLLAEQTQSTGQCFESHSYRL